MKREISGLVLIAALFFSCSKEQVKPGGTPTQTSTTTSTGSTSVGQTNNSTTGGVVTPIVVNGYLRLRLAEDSVNTDGILVNFTPSASAAYVRGEDAPSLQGFGQVSLASISSDHIPLAINVMPLTKTGTTIGLRVNAKSDGVYSLQMQQINSVPSSFSIWLMDAYKKDSLDMRLYPSYAFNIYKADTATFGTSRFKLVIRQVN